MTQGLTNAVDLEVHRTFVTLTAHHERSDPLDSLWSAIRKASTSMFAVRQGKAWRDSIGYVGRVIANEVTYGASGWHPHVHIVIFSKEPIHEEDVWRLWSAAAERNGLTVERVGLNVQSIGTDGIDASDVAAYVAKSSTQAWTLTDEMTAGAHAKVARSDRTTPFGLLDEIEATGDADAADAFIEYVRASKGVASVRWSPGLREALNVVSDDLTDEDAANETESDVTEVLTFTDHEWTAIHLGGYRVRVLEAADEGGIAAARQVVNEAVAVFYRRRRPPIGLIAQA